VLDAVKWNKSHAARVLGMDRRTLYRKIDRLGIDEPG
jgi:transcriptional regulator of acetoin/glycerol metabolism